MQIILIQILFAFATGLVGGYVFRSIGVPWAFALVVGYGLGVWLQGYLR